MILRYILQCPFQDPIMDIANRKDHLMDIAKFNVGII